MNTGERSSMHSRPRGRPVQRLFRLRPPHRDDNCASHADAAPVYAAPLFGYSAEQAMKISGVAQTVQPQLLASLIFAQKQRARGLETVQRSRISEWIFGPLPPVANRSKVRLIPCVAAVQASDTARWRAHEHRDDRAAAPGTCHGVVNGDVVAHCDLHHLRQQPQYRVSRARFAPESPRLTSTGDTDVIARSSSKNAVYSTNDS